MAIRHYELTFIVDPRLSDEETVALSDTYKDMATHAGGEVVQVESWGKRRLAYPIEKLTEGRYVLMHVKSEDLNPLPEVELRMRQNDKILRYLTVRTDREVTLTPILLSDTPEPAPMLDDDEEV